MTQKEAIDYLTPISESARLENYAAALKLAIDALRAQAAPPPNDPLTLEELREMDGEPVWIESKTAQYGNYWLIQVDGGIVSFRNRAGYGFRFEEVTDGWSSKIYRRKPEEGTS